MITTDVRLANEAKRVLSRLLGKRLDMYRCDEWDAHGEAPHVWGIVGLFVEQDAYAFVGNMERHFCFGIEEDIAVTSFSKVEPEEIKSRLVGVEQVNHPVGRIIRDILIFEDRQVMAEGGKDSFEYLFTSALVFQFDDCQLVIEPDGWIMEMFSIYVGKDAVKHVRNAVEDIAEEDRDRIRAERDVVSLGNL